MKSRGWSKRADSPRDVVLPRSSFSDERDIARSHAIVPVNWPARAFHRVILSAFLSCNEENHTRQDLPVRRFPENPREEERNILSRATCPSLAAKAPWVSRFRFIRFHSLHFPPRYSARGNPNERETCPKERERSGRRPQVARFSGVTRRTTLSTPVSLQLSSRTRDLFPRPLHRDVTSDADAGARFMNHLGNCVTFARTRPGCGISAGGELESNGHIACGHCERNHYAIIVIVASTYCANVTLRARKRRGLTRDSVKYDRRRAAQYRHVNKARRCDSSRNIADNLGNHECPPFSPPPARSLAQKFLETFPSFHGINPDWNVLT